MVVIKKITDGAGRVKQEALKIKQEARSHIVTAVGAAFAFIIALSWRDAIKKMLAVFVARLGVPETFYLYDIISAVIITVICVVGILIVAKFGYVKK